jgi:hypothetical protein
MSQAGSHLEQDPIFFMKIRLPRNITQAEGKREDGWID